MVLYRRNYSGVQIMTSGGHLVLPFGAFYGCAEARRHVDGIDAAVMNADPHRVVERHTHEDAHFVFVLEGLYVSSAVGAPAISRGPTLLFNPAGTTHRDHFEARSRLFEGRFLTLSVAAHHVDDAALRGTLPERAAVLTDPRGMALASAIARECVAWRGTSTMVMEDHAFALLAMAAQFRGTVERRAPGWLSTAREMLHDQCGDALSMVELARVAGVHPVHLARVFRRFLGCTPSDYVRRRRVERSRVLLRETTRPLSEIALSCGFVDQSHFAKAFKRRIGMTPGAFRRQEEQG
jgi:AraC family transcriptional regulator